MNGYLFLSSIIGIFLGYIIFYFRYQHKDVVNELRHNLKDANKEIHDLNQDLEEYIQQNNLLKNKVSELLDKNDDMSDVVSELSKYYVHIKRAAEKTSELTKFLQDPNPEIEEKMQKYLGNDKDDDMSKRFF